MRILFAGNEEDYASSIPGRENGKPFSLFFCIALPDAREQAGFDAIVIKALDFLKAAPLTRYIPLIASGPAELAGACFEAGCSDFIREPWTSDELQARIASHTLNSLAFNLEGLRISGHNLIGPTGEITLSDDAYSILMLLAANVGQPVPRMAIASLTGIRSVDSRSIDMRMARLRTALRSAGAGDMANRLRCTHGAYRFCT
jgi:DNA-binding response OmpR family regulator